MKIMKLKFYLCSLALCGAMTLQSCSDDNDPTTVSEAVQAAFQAKYPSVTDEKWELQSGYYVAEFWTNGRETDAWFTTAGEWRMTETDLGKDKTALPGEVKAAFESSDYNAWTVEDIDKYERTDKTFYLIEVETAGKPDHKLFYATDGTLLKSADDAENDDILPDTAI